MKHFEDFAVGESFEHGAYHLTAEEIVAFAQRYDPQPFHIDAAAAEAGPFGGLTASGFHTVAIQGALLHESADLPAVVAALGWDEVRFARPARAGDTLSIRVTCLEVRASRSRPDCGIVRTTVEVLDQTGQVVLSSIHSVLVKRRAEGDGTSG